MKVLIKIDNKLYKRIIKKWFDQFYKRVKTFFEFIIKYYANESYFKKYNNSNYREFAFIELDFT